MSRVVVTDHVFPSMRHEEAVARRHGAELAVHQCRTGEETADATAGADVVLLNFAPMPRRALEGLAPGATVVRYGVGYDNVDLDAATELGVRVANVPDYGTDTVADHATAALLALLRRLPQLDRAVRRDGWSGPAGAGELQALAAATVGLIGAGRIGRAVARRMGAFGSRVLAHDPYVDAGELAGHGIEKVELGALLEAADAVSLHAPATPETHHVIGREALARMKPGAVLVNTARGALVDEAALTEALADGRVSAAALDVFETEPLPADSPLREQPNVLLTPHAAFYSDRSVDDLQRLASEEAGRALAGEPLRCQIT